VLPGPEEALPPVEPKFTAIWRKRSAFSYFLYKSATFSLFFGLFPTFDVKAKLQFFSNFNSYSLFFSINTCDIKFRYFYG
jgi:hypothetical protein